MDILVFVGIRNCARTYVHWSLNICSSVIEHMFIGVIATEYCFIGNFFVFPK